MVGLSRAFEQGLPEAAQALTQLRRLAAEDLRVRTQGKQSKAAAEPLKNSVTNFGSTFRISSGSNRTIRSESPSSSITGLQKPCRSCSGRPTR